MGRDIWNIEALTAIKAVDRLHSRDEKHGSRAKQAHDCFLELPSEILGRKYVVNQ